MKYKYIGSEPALLIEQHKVVKLNDVIDVEQPLNSVGFVLVEEKKVKEEAVN